MKFHLSDVLAMTEGSSIGSGGMEQILRILEYLTGKPVSNEFSGAEAWNAVRETMYERHPFLEEWEAPTPDDVPDWIDSEEKYKSYVGNMIEDFAKKHDISMMIDLQPIPGSGYEPLSPEDALSQLFELGPVITIAVPHDATEEEKAALMEEHISKFEKKYGTPEELAEKIEENPELLDEIKQECLSNLPDNMMDNSGMLDVDAYTPDKLKELIDVDEEKT